MCRQKLLALNPLCFNGSRCIEPAWGIAVRPVASSHGLEVRIDLDVGSAEMKLLIRWLRCRGFVFVDICEREPTRLAVFSWLDYKCVRGRVPVIGIKTDVEPEPVLNDLELPGHQCIDGLRVSARKIRMMRCHRGDV